MSSNTKADIPLSVHDDRDWDHIQVD